MVSADDEFDENANDGNPKEPVHFPLQPVDTFLYCRNARHGYGLGSEDRFGIRFFIHEMTGGKT